MKKLILAIMSVFFLATSFLAEAVNVRGYYRKDGTYVRPHSRSSPDGIKSNNYGSASSSQRSTESGYSTLPSYANDYDGDGVANQYDWDDDNDGIGDDYE